MSRLLPLVFLLAACASPQESPTPFVLGDEVEPPPGCVEYRKRGGEC